MTVKRSRVEHRRGPRPAPPRRDVLKDQIARVTSCYPDDRPERHLANFRMHFGESSDEIYFRATRAIVVAARRWRKLANDRIKPLGQTMARWETLFLVAFSDEELTQSEIARLISVEGPTMVRMLDTLARDGLIERHQSDTDRRVTVNRVTPKGMDAIREIMAITNVLRTDLLKDIDPEHLAVTVDTLTQILRRLDEMRRTNA